MCTEKSVVCLYLDGEDTASLKPKRVSVKVPRKGASNIEMGRYKDSKNSFD